MMVIGQGCGSGIDSVRQGRIILPDPGVLHLGKFSVILMRFRMSNNASGLSTGRGERKRGHWRGGCARGRVTLHRVTLHPERGAVETSPERHTALGRG